MGWYGTYGQSIAECVRELTESAPWTDDAGNVHRRVTIAKTYKGGTNGTLYAVQDRVVTSPQGDEKVTRFILVAMIRYSREETMYKDMDCCMGPAQDSCPMKYIELLESHPSLASDHGKYCADWRASIRAKAAAKAEGRKLAKAVTPGAKIIANGWPDPFTVVGTRGRYLLVSGNGYGYARLSKSKVAAIAG
jgi:hypothetical protein